MAVQYFCKSEQRRDLVAGRGDLNGIDYLEVTDRNDMAQGRLLVHFVNALSRDLSLENIRIEGGQRIRNVGVASVAFLDKDRAADKQVVVVDVDKPGDFSIYRLHIVAGAGSVQPPEWMDPILAAIEFSFKVECASDFDCKREAQCRGEKPPEPEIDYLAKDYASFRQLMLDRLSSIAPKWQERNPADLGIAIVEVLAYSADHLSYYQDAVATEAYLGTSRRRVSVRRHARLLDYAMHEGCNARAWVVLEVGDGADGYLLRAHTPLLAGSPEHLIVGSTELPSATTQELSEKRQLSARTGVTTEVSPTLEDFVLFASESVRLGKRAEVHSGHVGANSFHNYDQDRDDPRGYGADALRRGRKTTGRAGWRRRDDDNHDDNFDQCWSVVVGKEACIHDQTSGVCGHRLKIREGAKVWDVYCNHLDSDGVIQGEEHKSLVLPILSRLPEVPDFEPGHIDIEVSDITTPLELHAGNYRGLRVYEECALILTGGQYDFDAAYVGKRGKICARAPCQVRIKRQVIARQDVHIGPEEDQAHLTSSDLVLNIGGLGVGHHALFRMCKNGHLIANVYAPNGALVLERDIQATGTFFGEHVAVGQRTQLHLGEKLQPPVEPEPPGRTCITELAGDVKVFETMHDLRLRQRYNRIEFYTWGGESCCLPKGATQATLDNHDGGLFDPNNPARRLSTGDLLLFEEIADADGVEANADREHRHVVRLTRVEPATDPLFAGRAVLNITWRQEDALPFPLCLQSMVCQSAQSEQAADNPLQATEVRCLTSVARGNVVLADHGRTICHEPLVPDMAPMSERYRPHLTSTDVTFRIPQTPEELDAQPASGLGKQDPRAALPDVALSTNIETWVPRRDLLNSDRFATEFVAETEEDGRTYIRFGDNILGRQPATGSRFTATYRVGNGAEGNVGAETITKVALPEGESDVQNSIRVVRNPLPAAGGFDPESIDEAKLYAPQAFWTQKRAVTVEDYADKVETHPDVQKAVGTQRWTGSWYSVFLTIDRKGGRDVDATFKQVLRDYLEPFRLMGHDLEIVPPRMVALEIEMTVCVVSDYLPSEVKATLLELFGSRELADGSSGLFHPDKWTFGQTVYLSPLIAKAMKVPGVVWVQTTKFQRWRRTSEKELETGVLTVGTYEIARLDNDPNAPENGQISFNMVGGL